MLEFPLMKVLLESLNFFEDAYSIQQTIDGGYIVAGIFTYHFWVLKLTSIGEIIWQKAYSNGPYDYAYSIQQTSDGGYIVAGQTAVSSTSYAFWVLKLDSNGNIGWQKAYGGGQMDYAYSIQQTSDGGYIVAGATDSFGAGYYDFWVLKLKSDGTIFWQKIYGGTNNDWAYSIQQTSDGGYIVAGYTHVSGTDWDFWVLKLRPDDPDNPSNSGDIEWQKRYGGTSDDYAHSIQQTSDGGYIVAGTTGSFGATNYDVWVLKLKSDGTIAFNPVSGAHMADTNIVPAETNAAVADTTAVVTPTLVTATGTASFSINTDATVVQQAP
jgi:uncharacterized delta-60 repeat protein